MADSVERTLIGFKSLWRWFLRGTMIQKVLRVSEKVIWTVGSKLEAKNWGKWSFMLLRTCFGLFAIWTHVRQNAIKYSSDRHFYIKNLSYIINNVSFMIFSNQILCLNLFCSDFVNVRRDAKLKLCPAVAMVTEMQSLCLRRKNNS